MLHVNLGNDGLVPPWYEEPLVAAQRLTRGKDQQGGWPCDEIEDISKRKLTGAHEEGSLEKRIDHFAETWWRFAHQ